MGRAFLALYRASADRAWLIRASLAADFIAANFARVQGGFVSARTSGPIAAQAQMDENISAARFANLLARYDGKAEHRALAETALRWLADPHVALAEITEPGVLLADNELHADPLHLTVLAGKGDAAGKVLFSTMQHLPPWYKRIDWWTRPREHCQTRREPFKTRRPRGCTERRCSLPMFSAAQITEFLKSSTATK